jgi:hypothetical protein
VSETESIETLSDPELFAKRAPAYELAFSRSPGLSTARSERSMSLLSLG